MGFIRSSSFVGLFSGLSFSSLSLCVCNNLKLSVYIGNKLDNNCSICPLLNMFSLSLSLSVGLFFVCVCVCYSFFGPVPDVTEVDGP